MTLQELQQQALKLSTGDRIQLAQTLLESLKPATNAQSKRGNLSRLRGIAKPQTSIEKSAPNEDYITYLTEKYQ